MKTPRLITLFTLALIASSTAANAEGIQLGRTRVIYDANKKEASLPLINSEKELPWLIQSWVMNADNKPAHRLLSRRRCFVWTQNLSKR